MLGSLHSGSVIPCRRYGLIGPNGCGKSCLLKSLAARDVPIPEHIDIYYLDREVAASDDTALHCVKAVDEEAHQAGQRIRAPHGEGDDT